jgi:hypothetical protein
LHSFRAPHQHARLSYTAKHVATALTCVLSLAPFSPLRSTHRHCAQRQRQRKNRDAAAAASAERARVERNTRALELASTYAAYWGLEGGRPYHNDVELQFQKVTTRSLLLLAQALCTRLHARTHASTDTSMHHTTNNFCCSCRCSCSCGCGWFPSSYSSLLLAYTTRLKMSSLPTAYDSLSLPPRRPSRLHAHHANHCVYKHTPRSRRSSGRSPLWVQPGGLMIVVEACMVGRRLSSLLLTAREEGQEQHRCQAPSPQPRGSWRWMTWLRPRPTRDAR